MWARRKPDRPARYIHFSEECAAELGPTLGLVLESDGRWWLHEQTETTSSNYFVPLGMIVRLRDDGKFGGFLSPHIFHKEYEVVDVHAPLEE
jgi:hypothetical protein